VRIWEELGFNPYFTGCSTSTIRLPCVVQLELRFNPYFTGCSTSTIFALLYHITLIVFQSLFYWMFYFNSKKYITIDIYERRFQSLFYWMFYFNFSIRDNNHKLHCSFNPYFTGCSTSTNKFRCFFPFEGSVSILILLDVLLQLIIQSSCQLF